MKTNKVMEITIAELYEELNRENGIPSDKKFLHPNMQSHSWHILKKADDFYELVSGKKSFLYSKEFIIRYEEKEERAIQPRRSQKNLSIAAEGYVHNILKEEAKKMGVKINCLVNNILIDWIINNKEEK